MTTTIERPAAAPALTDIPDEWTVEVTDEDIQLGVPEDVWSCAIARATRRALVLRGWMPPSGDVSVAYTYIDVFQRYTWDSKPRKWRHDAEEFVKRYDLGNTVEPQTVRFTAVR